MSRNPIANFQDFILDVVFNAIRMTSTVDINVLNASICQKFKCIFDQRRIGKRQKTLWQSMSVMIGCIVAVLLLLAAQG